MSTFLAIRKRSRVRTSGNLLSLSVEERRSRFVSEAPSVEFAEELTGLGFQRDALEGDMEGQTSSFLHLPGIDAYVLNTPDEQEIEGVHEIFEYSEYRLVPDIQLSLLEPISATGASALGEQFSWPVESGISEAHLNGVTGQGVLVGVFDTGCDADHIELHQRRIAFRYIPVNLASNGNPRDVRGFDVHGHGTHVCGIISGQNVGVAPAVDLMVASVIDSETLRTSLARILMGLDWMLSQFQREENLAKPAIVNMSLGFNPEWVDPLNLHEAMDALRMSLSTLLEDFYVLPIVAIGNDGPGRVSAPGYFPETLSVGAVDMNLIPAFFSGGGRSPTDESAQPDLVGYGVDVYSSVERDWDNMSIWRQYSGTSMAAPYVSGIAALYASVDVRLQGAALREHLLNTALRLEAPEKRVGAGLARFTQNA